MQSQPPPASPAQRTAEAKAAFTAALKSEGSKLDADLQLRAKDIHKGATTLAKQDSDVQKEIQKLSKQNDAMQKVVDKTRNEMKAYDDLPDIMADLERDLMIVEETLRIAEGNDQDEDVSAHMLHE